MVSQLNVCYCLLLGYFVSTTKLLDLPQNIAFLHISLSFLWPLSKSKRRRFLFVCLFFNELPPQKASKTWQTWWLLKRLLQIKRLTAPCPVVCRRACFGDILFFPNKLGCYWSIVFNASLHSLTSMTIWKPSSPHGENTFHHLIRKLLLQYLTAWIYCFHGKSWDKIFCRLLQDEVRDII